MKRLKKEDVVEVITGRDKGKSGKILKMNPKQETAVVEKVNLVKVHMKPTKDSKGGIVQVPKPIHLSKLALVGPKKKKIKVGYVINKGNKSRTNRETGDLL